MVRFGEGQTFTLWPDTVHAEAPHARGSAEVEPGRGKSCQRTSPAHTASAEGAHSLLGGPRRHAWHVSGLGRCTRERMENAFKIQALGVGRYFFIVKSVYSV